MSVTVSRRCSQGQKYNLGIQLHILRREVDAVIHTCGNDPPSKIGILSKGAGCLESMLSRLASVRFPSM